MKLSKRAKLVRAMELLARAVNDESIFESWLIYGVADGDIDGTETDEDLEYYCEDADFAELMHQFLGLMTEAYESGGLYCDGVTSGKVPRYLYNVVLSTYNEAETVREDVVELELEIEDEETAIELAKHQKVVLEPHQRVEVERRDFDSYNLIDIIEVN